MQSATEKHALRRSAAATRIRPTPQRGEKLDPKRRPRAEVEEDDEQANDDD
jgi:hypothetical protein